MPALSVTLLQPNLLKALFKKSVNVIIIIKWVTIRNTLYQILFSSQAAVKLNDLRTGSATIQFFLLLLLLNGRLNEWGNGSAGDNDG